MATLLWSRWSVDSPVECWLYYLFQIHSICYLQPADCRLTVFPTVDLAKELWIKVWACGSESWLDLHHTLCHLLIFQAHACLFKIMRAGKFGQISIFSSKFGVNLYWNPNGTLGAVLICRFHLIQFWSISFCTKNLTNDFICTKLKKWFLVETVIQTSCIAGQEFHCGSPAWK